MPDWLIDAMVFIGAISALIAAYLLAAGIDRRAAQEGGEGSEAGK